MKTKDEYFYDNTITFQDDDNMEYDCILEYDPLLGRNELLRILVNEPNSDHYRFNEVLNLDNIRCINIPIISKSHSQNEIEKSLSLMISAFYKLCNEQDRKIEELETKLKRDVDKNQLEEITKKYNNLKNNLRMFFNY